MLGFCIGMNVNEIKSINTFNNQPNQAFKNFRPNLNLNEIIFDKFEKENEKDLKSKVKLGSITAAVLSTLAVLYAITKKRKLNPLKNYNIFKQEIEPMDMLKITGVSVPAALLTGIALDKKENKNSKIREGISQMVGNLIIPICLIDQTLKFKDKIMNKNFTNPIMKTLQKTHKAAYTAVSLVGGLMIGNIIANDINSQIFPEHKRRPLKLKDFTVHFDDICFAASLILKGNKIGQIASRIIPATLLLSAYETGTKTKYED